MNDKQTLIDSLLKEHYLKIEARINDIKNRIEGFEQGIAGQQAEIALLNKEIEVLEVEKTTVAEMSPETVTKIEESKANPQVEEETPIINNDII